LENQELFGKPGTFVNIVKFAKTGNFSSLHNTLSLSYTHPIHPSFDPSNNLYFFLSFFLTKKEVLGIA
jgi:hypothetical protein